ncbi:MAG: hypothetical protein K6T75_07695 [Acetobacteraceae bacterium]|nr:hypothetical protein [Acetobacteraceae bacterium]
MKALNFYSSTYHGILVLRRKHCTIRVGDKSSKYREGDLVWVTYGDRFHKRRKVFTAVIDRLEVKKLSELTPEDLEGEDPEMKTVDEAARLLSRVYGRPVGPDELVSVVYFSEVSE